MEVGIEMGTRYKAVLLKASPPICLGINFFLPHTCIVSGIEYGLDTRL